MLRTVLHLRAATSSWVPVCRQTGQEKTRGILADVEHIIRPTPKPVPELRGWEKESYEPEFLTDDLGQKITPLGYSRSIITRLQEPIAIEPQELRYKLRQNKMRVLRIDQQYQERGLQPLGPDLLATRFLTARGARVKLISEDWLSKKDMALIHAYTKEDDPRIEAIDASGCSLVFEGFDYLRGLKHLRHLNLSDSHRLDDYCLYKLAFHLAPSLECLDLSDCPNISERGLATLHSLTNLKRLVVRNVTGVTQKQLVCLLLEESNPNLFIEGVTYSKETIDQEIEEDRKKYEERYGLRESADYVDNYLTENVAKVRFMEKFLRFLPKSSEKGFFAKFIGVKSSDERFSRVRDEF